MASGTLRTASRAASRKNCRAEVQADDANVSLKGSCLIQYTKDAQKTGDLASLATVWK